MFKNCPPEQISERDQELAQVKEDMEELKQQRITDAKKKMMDKKKELQLEKQEKLKEVKNKIYNERPQGTGSCIGESMNDYMSPVKARIGGAASAVNSPRNKNDLTATSGDDM